VSIVRDLGGMEVKREREEGREGKIDGVRSWKIARGGKEMWRWPRVK
jgi:hypothetical protein